MKCKTSLARVDRNRQPQQNASRLCRSTRAVGPSKVRDDSRKSTGPARPSTTLSYGPSYPQTPKPANIRGWTVHSTEWSRFPFTSQMDWDTVVHTQPRPDGTPNEVTAKRNQLVRISIPFPVEGNIFAVTMDQFRHSMVPAKCLTDSGIDRLTVLGVVLSLLPLLFHMVRRSSRALPIIALQSCTVLVAQHGFLLFPQGDSGRFDLCTRVSSGSGRWYGHEQLCTPLEYFDEIGKERLPVMRSVQGETSCHGTLSYDGLTISGYLRVLSRTTRGDDVRLLAKIVSHSTRWSSSCTLRPRGCSQPVPSSGRAVPPRVTGKYHALGVLHCKHHRSDWICLKKGGRSALDSSEHESINKLIEELASVVVFSTVCDYRMPHFDVMRTAHPHNRCWRLVKTW